MSVQTTLTHRVAGAAGATPPLLFLNGGMMSMASWDAIAAPFEAVARVVRCDLRGQLLSPGPPPPDLAGHAADVVALLDHLAMPRVHVVGTSFGALVGSVLAARHASRVASLALVTSTDRITPDMQAHGVEVAEAAAAAGEGRADGGRVLDLLLEKTYAPAYLAANRGLILGRRAVFAGLPRRWFSDLAGILATLDGLDLREELAAIRCPVLVLAGEIDATFPLAHSVATAAAVPGARLEVVAGAGHALVVECPEELVARLREFLDTLAGKDG